jgi:carboxypeptidase Taq
MALTVLMKVPLPLAPVCGEVGTLHTWLRDNLYRHGSKFVPNDLVRRATNGTMSMRPYLNYLHQKYAAVANT